MAIKEQLSERKLEILTDWIIPFVQELPNDDELLKEFARLHFISTIADQPYKIPGEAVISTRAKATIKAIKANDTKSIIAEIRNTQEFLIKMLRISLTDYNKLPKELEFEPPKINEIVNQYLNVRETKYSNWQGRGNNKIKGYKVVATTHNEIVLKTAIHIITGAFYSFEYSGKLIEGVGFDKVGLCPKCQKIFVKKRKDQVGCSSRCSNTIRVSKFRKK